MHRVIYVCGAIALALVITWVCFTFAGSGRNHSKPPVIIEHVNPEPPTAQVPDNTVPTPLPPIAEPPLPPVEPPPPVAETRKHAVVPLPHSKKHFKAKPHPRYVPPTPIETPRPFCFFKDELTGNCVL